jgi:hypothetical protein
LYIHGIHHALIKFQYLSPVFRSAGPSYSEVCFNDVLRLARAQCSLASALLSPPDMQEWTIECDEHSGQHCFRASIQSRPGTTYRAITNPLVLSPNVLVNGTHDCSETASHRLPIEP